MICAREEVIVSHLILWSNQTEAQRHCASERTSSYKIIS